MTDGVFTPDQLSVIEDYMRAVTAVYQRAGVKAVPKEIADKALSMWVELIAGLIRQGAVPNEKAASHFRTGVSAPMRAAAPSPRDTRRPQDR